MLKIKSKIFELIEKEVKDEKLKELINIQFVEDQWGSGLSELKSLAGSDDLNEFDYKVAKIFLCRDYSLTYRHGSSFDIIDEHDEIINNLKNDNQHHLALMGYMYHQFVIALGYMGKREDDRSNGFFDKAIKIYNELGAESQKADLIIQRIDFDYYYYDPLGIPELIDRYNNIPKELHMEKGIFFRLGVINLMGYLKSDKTKFLDDSINNLNKQLNSSDSDHYRNYLAKCALIIAQYGKNKNIDKLPNAPKGARRKAERFPLTMFLMLRAFRISGENKKSLRLLFNIERKLKKLITHFEDPDYKKFIFFSYGFIIEEWMLSIIEDTKLSNEQRFSYIIHVNEIIQNRLLADNLLSYLTEDGGLINIDEILNEVIQDEPDTGLIYITSTIRNIKNENQFIILNAEKIGDKDTYSINTINSNSLFEIENKFFEKFIIDPGSSKKEQDQVLDLYGETLFTDNDFLNSKNTLVVPNNFCLTLPVHMARIDGEYLYEKSDFRYLPNLHIVNSKNKKSVDKNSVMTIFYTSEDKNAAIEANAINESLPNKTIRIVKDPDLKTVKKELLGSDSVHTIAHGSDGNIIFNGYVIDGFDYCDAFPDDLGTVSFSVCRSGAILQKGLYPVDHVSWSHKLLKRRVKKVLTHSWDLGQHASNSYILNYYNNNDHMIMKKHKPSEYGGYMIWGYL